MRNEPQAPNIPTVELSPKAAARLTRLDADVAEGENTSLADSLDE